MIVRIMSDGQYHVDSCLFNTLNAIDDRIVGHVKAGEREAFAAGLAELIGVVKTEGQRVNDALILSSDVIVPYGDMTLSEAEAVFTGTGIFGG